MNYKQVAINAFVVFGILALAFLLWQFHHAVLLFFFSLAIAAAARPYVESLVQRGVSGSLAIILVYVLFIGLISLIFWAVGSSLLNELQHLADSLAMAYDRIWSTWPKGTQFEQMIVRQLPAPADLYKTFSPEQQSSMMNSMLGFTMTSANMIGEAFTVLVLSIYWGIDRVHFERLWLSLLPVESRARARDIYRAIDRGFGAYVRSEVLQSIIAGLLIGFGLWAMGINYPTLLAVFAALAWLIPWLGGVLAVLPVAIVGFSQSIGLGALATLYAIAVLFFLELVIEPRFIRRHQFSSLLSILIIIALIEPFGLLGLLVAPPIAATIELIFRYNLRMRPVPPEVQRDEKIEQLRARANHLRQLIQNHPEEPEPQTMNMLERLDNLLNRSDKVMEESMPKPRMSNRVRF